MKRKNCSVFIIMIAFGLLLGLTGCTDDKDPGGNDQLNYVTIYDAGESVYSGEKLSLNVQYANVDGGYKDCPDIPVSISKGKITVTLPVTPLDDALFDGKGWDEDASGIDMAHYSFETIGIGKSYAEASHLELYWFKEDVGDIPAGWHWLDGEHCVYVSLQEAVEAGNKLYVADLITYTVSAEGGMNSETLQLTFSNDVPGLTEGDILILPDTGDAGLEEGLSGSSKQWKANISSRAAGEVKVLIDKWGVSRQGVTTSVSYVPLNLIDPRNRHNWMKDVPDDRKLKDLCIPGTHDSGAWHWLNGGMVRCQSRTIGEQLNDGIRFLDVRVNAENGRINHGPIMLPDNSDFLNLSEVIDDCISFLKDNPSETILVMLSWEHGGNLSDFMYRCGLYAFNPKQRPYWYEDGKISPETNLADVRGKMVLVNGDETARRGLSAKDFISQNEWDIGDHMMFAAERAKRKYNAIGRFITETRKHADTFNVSEETYYEKTFWNFILGRWWRVSGSKTITYTRANNRILRNCWNKQFNSCVPVVWYAKEINSKMHNYTKYPRGIQLMDFYDQVNVDRVIDSNF